MSELFEPNEGPEIEMTPAAVTALLARGGNLYVWADKAGLLCARVTQPPESLAYDTVVIEGCSIHVERGIAPAPGNWCWEISWRRFPWPRFSATTRRRSSLLGAVGHGVDIPWP